MKLFIIFISLTWLILLIGLIRGYSLFKKFHCPGIYQLYAILLLIIAADGIIGHVIKICYMPIEKMGNSFGCYVLPVVGMSFVVWDAIREQFLHNYKVCATAEKNTGFNEDGCNFLFALAQEDEERKDKSPAFFTLIMMSFFTMIMFLLGCLFS